MSRATALGRAFAPVVAEGSDPALAAAVLAWLLPPRRSPAALQRRVAQLAERDAGRPAELLAAAVGAPDPALSDNLVQLADRWHTLGVQLALVGDPAYPTRLAAGWPLLEAPALLAWRGCLPAARPTVAVVGARRATGYGTGVAAWLAEAASGAGVTVVSGGALGVDAAAHAAALEGPGGTTVVLGCGHGVAYPRPHARAGGLFDRIVDHGGALVSELLPWQPPIPAHVRARNRVVAGLADALVVVEGGERSGSLLTAGVALERGLPVLAVPGDVRAPGSVAPHRLLSEGAAPCTGPADLLDAVGQAAAGDAPAAGVPAPVGDGGLPPEVRAVLVDAWPRPVPLELLARRSGQPTGVLLAAVTRARVLGVLAEGPEGLRLRRAPAPGGTGGA